MLQGDPVATTADHIARRHGESKNMQCRFIDMHVIFRSPASTVNGEFTIHESRNSVGDRNVKCDVDVARQKMLMTFFVHEKKSQLIFFAYTAIPEK